MTNTGYFTGNRTQSGETIFKNGNYHCAYTSYKCIVNYEVGDFVASKLSPDNVIGQCTGFTADDTCIVVDGKCRGGKFYFEKATTIDLIEGKDYKII